MTEAAQKFIPVFVGLFLILRGLFWIVDGKKWKQDKLFLWHSSYCDRNHHVHYSDLSGSVKKNIDAISSIFL